MLLNCHWRCHCRCGSSLRVGPLRRVALRWAMYFPMYFGEGGLPFEVTTEEEARYHGIDWPMLAPEVEDRDNNILKGRPPANQERRWPPKTSPLVGV